MGSRLELEADQKRRAGFVQQRPATLGIHRGLEEEGDEVVQQTTAEVVLRSTCLPNQNMKGNMSPSFVDMAVDFMFNIKMKLVPKSDESLPALKQTPSFSLPSCHLTSVP